MYSETSKNGFSFKSLGTSMVIMIAALFSCFSAFAQPSNDNCATPTVITVNPDGNCTNIASGTTVAATASPNPAPSCLGTGANDDVWFSFVAGASLHQIALSNVSGTSTDMAMSFYSGSCGSLTELGCSDPNIALLGGLTPGQTYYVRVWTATSGTGTASFNICVTTPPASPANDNCSAATPLTPAPSLTCVTQTAGTTISALPSPTAPVPACQIGINDDVWYSFVATSAAHNITLSSITGSATDLAMAVYSGTCGSLTEILCSDPEAATASGLTVGQTYYIRVWTVATAISNTASFNICITTPPPPPANDNCNGATPLTVNSSTTCTSTTAGNTLNATQSSTPTNPTCGTALGWNDDVWYSFVATGTAHIVTLSSVSAGTSMTFAVYSGPCTNLTQIYCANANTGTFGGLTAGQTYYIRVWTNVTTATTSASFNICVATPPPPPANDDCTGAISLTVNPTLTCNATTAGTTVSSTASSAPAPTCVQATGTNDDVWYSFVATGPSHQISLLNVTGGTTDMAMAVYSGSCTGLSEIGCSDPNTMMVTGLTAGQTYYIRVWTWTATATTTASFNICVGTPPPPPANDECSGAVSVPVNPTLTCTQTVAGTTVSATPSTAAPAPGCVLTTGTNDDVWFSFVATNPIHQISLLNITGGTTDMAMTVYSGTCTNLTEIGCSDPETMAVGGLVPGQTYYVRVWTWTSTVGTTASFNICIGTPPPPPANDNCTGAVSLVPSTTPTCGTLTAGTTAWATPSAASVPASTCTPTGANDDVWYSFVASSSYHNITLTGATLTMAITVYAGTCNGTLTQVACVSGNSLIVTGLTVGQTYLVRVYTQTAAIGSGSIFNICVATPPPPPANDNPCTATLLTVDPVGNCNYQTFTNESASPTQGVSTPTCANYQGGDVWFKVVVPCTGKITVDTDDMGITDGGMAFYSGSCGNLTQIGCDDDSSPNGAMPMLSASNLTPGDTVWIRVWSYGNSVQGTFGICASTNINSSAQGGAVCANSVSFCTQNPSTAVSITGQTGLGQIGCLFSTPNPQWYFLSITQAGDLHFTINQVNLAGTGIDVDYALFGPFNTVSQGCTAAASANNIISCSYSAAPTEYVNVLNVQVGQVYILLVTNFNGGAGTTTFTPNTTGVPPGPPTGQPAGINTAQSNCCSLTASNSSPVCAGGFVNLSASTVPGATYQWVGPYCFSSTQQNPTNVQVPTVPGVYVYQVQAINANGTASCVDTTWVTVVAAPNLGRDTTVRVCASANLGVNLNNYVTPANFSTNWTMGGLPVTRPDSVWYGGLFQIIASSPAGCKDTALVRLIVDTIKTNPVVTQPNCTGKGSIVMNVTQGIPPYTYAIGAGTFGTNNTFSNLSAGTYTISVKDSLQCVKTQTFVLRDTNNLYVKTINDTLLCNGNSVPLTTISNATSYQWSPTTGLSSATVQSPIASPTSTTTTTIRYIVTATLGTCVKKDTVDITVDPGLVVSAGPDISVLTGETATIQGSVTGSPSSILWTPTASLTGANTLTPVVTANFVGSRTYTLTVRNNVGCVSKDSMIVNVIPNCVVTRNAFSPNGDGINDTWRVYDSYVCLKNVQVFIYNRYGAKVYENKDYRNDWGGTYKGKAVPDGTYYAVVKYTLINGREITTKTDVNIIR